MTNFSRMFFPLQRTLMLSRDKNIQNSWKIIQTTKSFLTCERFLFIRISLNNNTVITVIIIMRWVIMLASALRLSKLYTIARCVVLKLINTQLVLVSPSLQF